MRYQAHRGVSSEFPENTMSAFRAAVMQKYDVIEIDPSFTVDGKCVVFHDQSLARIFRTANGRKLKSDIKISDITFEELSTYDAGIHKSAKFRGEQAPLLSTVLSFAAEKDIPVNFDNRIAGFSEDRIQSVFHSVKESGITPIFTCSNVDFVHKVASEFPDAEIHYDGCVEEKTLCDVLKELKNNPLTVWLPIENKDTLWANMPFADEKLCKTVKKYAQLGLWILTNENELETAEHLGADIIETTGTLKPPTVEVGMFDCHNHTIHSHDSMCDVHALCDKAAALGLSGISLTDHCDIEFCMKQDVLSSISDSVSDAESLKIEYTGKLNVFSGVEIGESIYYPGVSDRVLNANNYDIVLGSVHAVRFHEYNEPYSQIDFSKMTQDVIESYIKAYFNDVEETVETRDFDALSHLTCPLRYIVGKYGLTVDLDKYSDQIEKILTGIIKRGIALEVNTSESNTSYGITMPDEAILARYRSLGGYLITLGSDSHVAENVSNGFTKVKDTLIKIGFKNAFYYRDRIPVQYALKCEY